jgi:hypothetical protein
MAELPPSNEGIPDVMTLPGISPDESEHGSLSSLAHASVDPGSLSESAWAARVTVGLHPNDVVTIHPTALQAIHRSLAGRNPVTAAGFDQIKVAFSISDGGAANRKLAEAVGSAISGSVARGRVARILVSLFEEEFSGAELEQPTQRRLRLVR